MLMIGRLPTEIFNDYQEDFEIHEENIRKLAQQFRGLIQKIKNMCSSDARILKDIAIMRQKLEGHLKSVTSLNAEVQNTSVHIIGSLSRIEEHVKKIETEKWNSERHQESLRQNMANAESRLSSLRNEKAAFEKKLEELREIVSLQKKLLWIPITGWAFAAGMEIGKQITDFDKKVQRAKNDIEYSNTRIASIRSEINSCHNKIYQNDQDIRTCQQRKCDAQLKKVQLEKKQNIINVWLKAINAWLEYLTNLEPQVERVERHIGNNEAALQRSIGDLKNCVINMYTASIEFTANKLAITYTSFDTPSP
jgi:DNA repair ATPase RecN